MTQLTKREQIAFALFLEQYKSDNNGYSVDEMIRKSVFIADAFLKHLSETEPMKKEMKGNDIDDYLESLHKFKLEKPKQPEEYPRSSDSPDSRPMNAEEIAEWVCRVSGMGYQDGAILIESIKLHAEHEVNKEKF